MTSQSRTPIVVSVDLDDRVKLYLFWYLMGIMLITIVGIPLIPFVAIFYWIWYAPRYGEYHTLDLNGSGIVSKRGVVFRSQTNVPVDRITDIAVHQGPLMRRFGIYKVTIESAGQTQIEGAASVIGVVEPYDFRDAVLENVELMKQSTAEEKTPSDSEIAVTSGSDAHTGLLTEIRDILARMEARDG